MWNMNVILLALNELKKITASTLKCAFNEDSAQALSCKESCQGDFMEIAF